MRLNDCAGGAKHAFRDGVFNSRCCNELQRKSVWFVEEIDGEPNKKLMLGMTFRGLILLHEMANIIPKY